MKKAVDYPAYYELSIDGIGQGLHLWGGSVMTFNIDGLDLGVHFVSLQLTDTVDNMVQDNVEVTVEDTTNPIITGQTEDLIVELGYSGQIISWTATDINPNVYIIELQGTGVVVESTAWITGDSINYIIPDGFPVGEYIYSVTFMDEEGNYQSGNINFTVEDTIAPVITHQPVVDSGSGGGSDNGVSEAIPGYDIFLLLGMLGVISIIIIRKYLNLIK